MLEELPPLSSMNFFALQSRVFFSQKTGKLDKRFLLPSTSQYLDEEEFAKVYFAWNKEGLIFNVESTTSFQKISYPDFKRGDSVELFIDTRDAKESSWVTKFCHHFVFFPEQSPRGFLGEEVSRFRSDDFHTLCNEELLIVKSTLSVKSYFLEIKIPEECLFGFDRETFNRLGFTYRINRTNGNPQHFALSSLEMNIERFPNLWSSLELVK